MSTDLNMEYQEVKFGEIAKHISKRVEPSETTLEIYVGLEHLDPDSLKITRHGVPSDVAGQKLLVKKGQIIFGKRRAYQRKVAVADWDCICSAHAMVLEAIPGKILPEFLPFFMQSNQFMERAVEISEGSLSPTIKWKVLEYQKFHIPTLKSQEKILNIISDLEKYLEQVTILISYSKNLICNLRALFFKSDDDYIQLSQIANIVMGQSPKGEFCFEEFTEGALPLLNGPTEFTQISPIPKQYTTSITKIAEVDDILFCVRGSTTGRMNIADQQYCIGRGLAAISTKGEYPQEYIYHLLEFIKTRIFEHAKGQGSTFPNITGAELKSWKIPSLEIGVAIKYTNILEKILKIIALLDMKLSNVINIKMNLINSEI